MQILYSQVSYEVSINETDNKNNYIIEYILKTVFGMEDVFVNFIIRDLPKLKKIIVFETDYRDEANLIMSDINNAIENSGISRSYLDEKNQIFRLELIRDFAKI